MLKNKFNDIVLKYSFLEQMGRDFVIYALTVAVLYGGSAYHLNINVDSEIAMYRIDHTAWIGDGRWMNFLIERFLFPQSVAPLFNILLFSGALSFCYLIIIFLFRLEVSFFLKWLIFIMLSANPLWIHILVFPSNTIPISIGIIILAFQILIFEFIQETKNKNITYLGLLILSFSYAALIGIYQSLLFLGPIIMILFFIYALSCQDKSIVNFLTTIILTTIVGGVLYFLIQKIFITAYPHSMEYINGYIPGDFFAKSWFQRKYDTLIDVINTLSGSKKIWQTDNSFLLYIIAISILAIMLKIKNKGFLTALICGALLLLALTFPFFINLMRMMPMPLRTYVSLPILYITLLILALKVNKRQAVKFLIIAGIFAADTQMLYSLSLYQNSILNARDRDKAIAFDLYNKIVNAVEIVNPNDNISVDIRGEIKNDSPFPKSETIGASIFEWDHGNPWRMMLYMKAFGYKNITAVNPLAKKEDDIFFKNMQTWPHGNSVIMHNNVVLVKLSD